MKATFINSEKENYICKSRNLCTKNRDVTL